MNVVPFLSPFFLFRFDRFLSFFVFLQDVITRPICNDFSCRGSPTKPPQVQPFSSLSFPVCLFDVPFWFSLTEGVFFLVKCIPSLRECGNASTITFPHSHLPIQKFLCSRLGVIAAIQVFVFYIFSEELSVLCGFDSNPPFSFSLHGFSLLVQGRAQSC